MVVPPPPPYHLPHPCWPDAFLPAAPQPPSRQTRCPDALRPLHESIKLRPAGVLLQHGDVPHQRVCVQSLHRSSVGLHRDAAHLLEHGEYSKRYATVTLGRENTTFRSRITNPDVSQGLSLPWVWSYPKMATDRYMRRTTALLVPSARPGTG